MANTSTKRTAFDIAQERAQQLPKPEGSPLKWKPNEVLVINCYLCDKPSLIQRCVCYLHVVLVTTVTPHLRTHAHPDEHTYRNEANARLVQWALNKVFCPVCVGKIEPPHNSYGVQAKIDRLRDRLAGMARCRMCCGMFAFTMQQRDGALSSMLCSKCMPEVQSKASAAEADAAPADADAEQQQPSTKRLRLPPQSQEDAGQAADGMSQQQQPAPLLHGSEGDGVDVVPSSQSNEHEQQ